MPKEKARRWTTYPKKIPLLFLPFLRRLPQRYFCPTSQTIYRLPILCSHFTPNLRAMQPNKRNYCVKNWWELAKYSPLGQFYYFCSRKCFLFPVFTPLGTSNVDTEFLAEQLYIDVVDGNNRCQCFAPRTPLCNLQIAEPPPCRTAKEMHCLRQKKQLACRLASKLLMFVYWF